MSNFANPWFLLLLLAVPPLLWWWLRRHRGSLRYPDTGPLAALPTGRSRLARWGGIVLRTAGLVLTVVALAGPRWPDSKTRIATEGIAIQMLLDVSGSMAEEDFRWEKVQRSRLFAVKEVFRLFVAGGEGPNGITLEGRPNDLIGLITFATHVDSACPLTLSHSALLHILKDQQARTVPGESRTNIGDAIALGLYRLQKAEPKRKVMILLSDGEHNVPKPAKKPRWAARRAADLDIPIYTIDAGSDVPSTSDAALEGASAEDRLNGKKTLQEVARITGGQYFQAQDTETLLDVCRQIDALEREEIESFQYRRYDEGYPWFGLAALVCWVLVHFLELTFWRKVP
jgi:Ca-activated chloride channel family protein